MPIFDDDSSSSYVPDPVVPPAQERRVRFVCDDERLDSAWVHLVDVHEDGEIELVDRYETSFDGVAEGRLHPQPEYVFYVSERRLGSTDLADAFAPADAERLSVSREPDSGVVVELPFDCLERGYVATPTSEPTESEERSL